MKSNHGDIFMGDVYLGIGFLDISYCIIRHRSISGGFVGQSLSKFG
jgi:hypothetical protein